MQKFLDRCSEDHTLRTTCEGSVTGARSQLRPEASQSLRAGGAAADLLRLTESPPPAVPNLPGSEIISKGAENALELHMCFPNTQGLSPPLPSPWYRVNRPSRGKSPGTEMTMSHFCVCPAKRGQSQQATEGPASPSGPAWAFKRRTSSSGMQSVASREQAGFRHPCPAQTTTSDAIQPTIPVSPGLGLILCSRNKNHRRWSVQSIALRVWDAFRPISPASSQLWRRSLGHSGLQSPWR